MNVQCAILNGEDKARFNRTTARYGSYGHGRVGVAPLQLTAATARVLLNIVGEENPPVSSGGRELDSTCYLIVLESTVCLHERGVCGKGGGKGEMSE